MMKSKNKDCKDFISATCERVPNEINSSTWQINSEIGHLLHAVNKDNAQFLKDIVPFGLDDLTEANEKITKLLSMIEECKWERQEDGNPKKCLEWGTDCGFLFHFTFIQDLLNFEFCPYCGRRILKDD